ncbi:hypothetical protein CAPTEDRAFT_222693 [Capitella teleta]|uniref:C3H1-type domain-containing protein n=1 Tax=Capitella teleta TaxID=283909 RepID=R7TP91_CAPTE|nr:hypothetical protein CAPTEDRAFT_222693 [Capitella teleta]|eukprot:ELT95713.1 hypothetical protein CAPTEDRAFT_222693 [Capitella teleta]
MSSSKSRRRVTVDQEPLARSSESLSEKRTKRSVFQRLGSVPAEVCHLWVSTGHCNYGSSCKFNHPTSASRGSKESNERERSPDDLRHRMPPRKRNQSQSDHEESRPKKRDRSERQAKEGKAVKSAVIVGRSARESDYEAPLEQPEDSDLDMDSTRLLMKKRLQLQQQLNELEEAEKAEQDDPISPSGPHLKQTPEEVLDDMYRQKPRERFLEEDPLHRHKPKEKKKKKRKEKLRRSDPPPPPPQLPEGDEFAGAPVKRRHSRDQPKGKARSPELKKLVRPSRSRSPHVKKKALKKKREVGPGEVDRKNWGPKKEEKRLSLSPRGKAAKHLKHERKRSLSPERRKAEGMRSSRGRAREGARRKSSTTSSTSSSSSSSSSSSTSGSSSSSSSSASSRERLKKKGQRKMLVQESVKGRMHKPPPLRHEEPVRREDEVLVPPPPPPQPKEEFRRGPKPDYSKAQRALSPKEGRPKRHDRSLDYREQKKEDSWKREEVASKESSADYQKRYDRQYRDDYYQREKEARDKGREPREGERDRERAPREDDRGREDLRESIKDADKMRYRDVERTRSREDERMRAAEDPRLRESERLKAERDFHLYFKEYEQLRLHEHASKYQEVYAAEMARHAEHYDRAAYERYAVEARKDDPRVRGAEYAQGYSRDERVEAYYRYRRELEEGHRHDDRSRGHDDRRRIDDAGRAVVDDRGRYVDDRGRLLDKREAERARYDERARLPEERSRHYDSRSVRDDPRVRGAYADPAGYAVEERHSRRQHWEDRSETHGHHGDQYDERSRAAYSSRRRPEETASPRSANSPSGSVAVGHPDYKRDSDAFRTASQTRDQSWDRRAPRPKEEGGRSREWEEHHAREARAPEEDVRPRSQPRSGSYDKRRRSSPSWDDRDAKRSRKDRPQGEAPSAYNRDADWSADAAKRGTEAHRSSSKDPREHEERTRRSPSRSSLGSRHSYRDDRYRGDYERNRGEPVVAPPEEVKREASPPKKEIITEDEVPEKKTEEEKEVVVEEVPPPKEEINEEVQPKAELEVVTPVEEDTPTPEAEKIEEEIVKVIEKASDEVETVSSNGDLSSQSPEEVMDATPDDGGLSPEYDDISDDDLDELFDKEAEQEKEDAKKEVDSLGIDWQSLAGSTAAPQATDQGALQRFTPAALLTSIGFSEKYAGRALSSKAKELCNSFLNEGKKAEDGNSDVTVSLSGVKRSGHRENTLQDVGRARRALCARRDLYLRRKLCKVDKFPEGFVLYALPIVDQELYRQSMTLFQQNRQVNSTS